ncbi:MAG TPA: transposase [Candidatus Competibacteraceae bacterium]|nr:transposase [Candidatus Competibacteraceae bacterium]
MKANGRREGLGFGLGPSPAREFWVEFRRGWVRRGLRGVQLVISDAYEGLTAAIAQVLNAPWQRCRVPCMGTGLVCVPKAQQGMGWSPPCARGLPRPIPPPRLERVMNF